MERVLTMKKMLAFLFTLAMIFCLPLSAMAYEYHGPETELVALANRERKANGIPPLTIDWEITRLAQYKTEEMKNHRIFCHESLVYGSPTQMLDRFHVPYSAVGANIAMGQETPAEVINAWLNAPGHHANLTNPHFTKAGVGLSWDENGIPYWTLMLAAGL